MTPQQGLCIATGSHRGLRALHGSIELFSASGAPILDLKGLRCVTYLGFGTSESGDDMSFRTPYMRLEWKSDIDFLDNNAARMLFPPVGKVDAVGPVFDALDRLTAHIVVDQSQVWQGMPPDPKSYTLRRFLKWLAQRGSLCFGDEALS